MVEAQAHGRYRRAIATWDDVSRICLALPATEAGTTFRTPAWKVGTRAFAWVRPLGNSDRRALEARGRAVPAGEILGVRVASMEAKDAALERFSEHLFDIPHFAHYAAVLVRLDDAPEALLEDLIADAWLAMAPPKLAAEFRAAQREAGTADPPA